MRRPIVAVALVVSVVALAASGCGGSSSSSSDVTPTDEWASSFCTALTTWTTSISSVGDSIRKNGVSKDALESAATDAKDATTTLADDLQGLGKPDTESGQQAKESLDQLSSELRDDAQQIEDAADNVSGITGVLTAVSSVASTLTAMGKSVQSTFKDLSQLDAKGELEDAISSSSACNDLTK